MVNIYMYFDLNKIRITIAKIANWKNIRMSRGKPFYGDDEGQSRYNALCGSPPNEALTHYEELPNYTGSYDCIIPIIQKICNDQSYKKWFNNYFQGQICDYWDHSPLQLCILVLKSTNNWDSSFKLI